MPDTKQSPVMPITRYVITMDLKQKGAIFVGNERTMSYPYDGWISFTNVSSPLTVAKGINKNYPFITKLYCMPSATKPNITPNNKELVFGEPSTEKPGKYIWGWFGFPYEIRSPALYVGNGELVSWAGSAALDKFMWLIMNDPECIKMLDAFKREYDKDVTSVNAQVLLPLLAQKHFSNVKK